MRFTILFLALAAIAMPATAQKFVPGYYINPAGDTIKANLSIQKKNQSIDKVVTAEGLFLAPKDLLGFGLNDINYVVKSVSVDKSPDFGVVTDTVFLEIMNRSKMSLYTMIDENEKAHYYIENENGTHELSIRLVRKPEMIQWQRIETYKSTLKGLFPACTGEFAAIDKTVLSRKGMQAIFNKLYTCRFGEEPAKMKKEKDDVETNFGVLAGVSITDMSFTGKKNITSLVHTLKFKNPSIDPTLGIFIETRFSRTKMFAARHEFTYRQYVYQSEVFKPSPYAPNNIWGDLSVKYLKYSLVARIYLLTPDTKLRPFVDFGPAPAYAISVKQSLTREGGSNAGVSPLFIDSISKFELGLFGGAGVIHKNFSFEIRYETSSGLHPKECNTKVQTVYANLSYRLFGTK